MLGNVLRLDRNQSCVCAAREFGRWVAENFRSTIFQVERANELYALFEQGVASYQNTV